MVMMIVFYENKFILLYCNTTETSYIFTSTYNVNPFSPFSQCVYVAVQLARQVAASAITAVCTLLLASLRFQ